MLRFLRLPVLSCLTVLLPLPGAAQELDEQMPAYRQSIAVQPLSLLSGLSASYEFVAAGRHGLVAEGGYNAWGTSAGSGLGALGYRYHFEEGLAGPFLGVFAKAAYVEGEVEAEDKDKKRRTFTFNTDLFAAGLNYGYRWQWDNRLNMVLRGGYGIPFADIQWSPGEPEPSWLSDFMHLALGADFEWSVGYSF